jgi:hypothetical protein
LVAIYCFHMNFIYVLSLSNCWIYIYLFNQCISPLTLWVLIRNNNWSSWFNATLSNILVWSWRSVVLVKETKVHKENHRPAASHLQALSHNVVSCTSGLSGIRTHNVRGDMHWLNILLGCNLLFSYEFHLRVFFIQLLDLHLLIQSVHITSNVVSSNPVDRSHWPQPLGHRGAYFKMRHMWRNNNWSSWFNATLSNILVWSWRSVVLVKETKVHKENHYNLVEEGGCMFSEISEWPQVINNNILLGCNLLFSYEFHLRVFFIQLLDLHPFPPFKSHSCHGFLKFIDVQFASFKHSFTHFRRVVFSIRCRT